MTLFQKKRWRLWLLYGIAILILYMLFRIRVQLMTILSPFLMAIVFAYLLNPVVNFIEKKGLGRILSIVVVYLLFIGIFVILGWSIIPQIINETSKLVSDLPEYAEEIQTFIKEFRESSQSQLPESVNSIINDNINRVESVAINSLQRISMVVVNFFSRFLNIVIVPIVAFYFLKDKNDFKRRIILLIPQKWRSQILEVSRDVDKVIGNFIRGQILVGIFVGGMTFIGLYILKINYALVIGLIAGLSNIIPYFGPIIGAIPAIIVALIQEPSKVLWVIGLFVIVQQVESGIISPKIIGTSVGLHPVMIMLSLLIGGSFFGIIGMLLAVPLTATLKVIGEHVIDHIASGENY